MNCNRMIPLTKGSVTRTIGVPPIHRLAQRSARMGTAEYKKRFKIAAHTSKWAVTMTKVRIRRAVSEAPWPHWHFVDFCGPHGCESRGVADLIAIRKDHGPPRSGTKRGDAFQIILIQVKGGYAAKPTAEDGERLRRVALSSWRPGDASCNVEKRNCGSLFLST